MDIFDLLHLAISIFIVASVAFVVFGLIALVFALRDPDWQEADAEVLSRLDAEDAEQVVTPVPTREDVGREDIDIHLIEQRRN